MDRLDAMQVLLTVVDEGSVSAGSRKLRTPLPSVSRTIRTNRRFRSKIRTHRRRRGRHDHLQTRNKFESSWKRSGNREQQMFRRRCRREPMLSRDQLLPCVPRFQQCQFRSGPKRRRNVVA